MALTQTEFDAIISDASKKIVGDIEWVEDEDHSSSVEFRAEIESANGSPLFVRGSFNRAIGTLTYAIISKLDGRLYALDLGKDHRNADTGELVGEKHKHRWTEAYKDKIAYVPSDITEPATNPATIWHQFCNEAKLTHDGELRAIPPLQEDLFS